MEQTQKKYLFWKKRIKKKCFDSEKTSLATQKHTRVEQNNYVIVQIANAFEEILNLFIFCVEVYFLLNVYDYIKKYYNSKNKQKIKIFYEILSKNTKLNILKSFFFTETCWLYLLYTENYSGATGIVCGFAITISITLWFCHCSKTQELTDFFQKNKKNWVFIQMIFWTTYYSIWILAPIIFAFAIQIVSDV